MDINEAHAVIRAAVDELNAVAKAKGKNRPVYLTFCDDYTSISSGGDIAGLFAYGKPADELIAFARKVIDDLHDPHAYDDELSQPLFLMSEQHAQAAE